MQSLHDLSHLEIIFQKAQSHISMVLFVAYTVTLVKSSPCKGLINQNWQRQVLISQRKDH